MQKARKWSCVLDLLLGFRRLEAWHDMRVKINLIDSLLTKSAHVETDPTKQISRLITRSKNLAKCFTKQRTVRGFAKNKHALNWFVNDSYTSLRNPYFWTRLKNTDCDTKKKRFNDSSEKNCVHNKRTQTLKFKARVFRRRLHCSNTRLQKLVTTQHLPFYLPSFAEAPRRLTSIQCRWSWLSWHKSASSCKT